MSNDVLFEASGSKLLTNTWAQKLTITGKGVRGYVRTGFRKMDAFLTFKRISQVNVTRHIFTASIEILSNGTDSILIRGLSKRDAMKAKHIIEERMD